MKTCAKIFLIVIGLQMPCVVMAQVDVATNELAGAKLVQANNAFAVDLYTRLAKEPGNFVFSPFSINTALTMAYAGARGNTAAQMARVLHDSNTSRQLQAEFGALLDHLNGVNLPGTEFLVANSLWAQRGYPFLKPYQQLLQDHYKTSMMQIDLTGWPGLPDEKIMAAARGKINDWAASHTGGKIKELLPGEFPAPDTRLILLDAVYFKGLWETQFERTNTTKSLFQISPGKSVTVPTMHAHGDFLVFKFPDEVHALQLPYLSNRLSMVILLPQNSDGLPELEQSFEVPLSVRMNAGRLEKIMISRLDEVIQLSFKVPLDVALPRFEGTSKFDLQKPLVSMGMTNAFDESADFSGVSTEKPFYIGAALHQATISVDEQGTEAAASASVEWDAKGSPRSFIVDHPFLYYIRDNQTGAILFMGRVVDPSIK